MVNEVARHLFNIGSKLQISTVSVHKVSRAINLYTNRITIQERLRDEGKLLDEKNLAGAYMNRGGAFFYRQELDSAIEDYNRAIEIRRRIIAAGRFWIRDQLFSLYFNTFQVLKETNIPEVLHNLFEMTLYDARESLTDGKLTSQSFNELHDLAGLAVRHSYIPEKYKKQWKIIFQVIEKMKT